MQFELIREYESVIWPQARASGLAALSNKRDGASGSGSDKQQHRTKERKRLTPKEEAAARKRAWAEQQAAASRANGNVDMNPKSAIYLGPRPGEDWGNGAAAAGGAIRPEL
jgi:hypothetical protein